MYRVELQNFEGPLDLLLFFIKRDEIDIKDIPIARITSQFVDYLYLMEELDLEIASEFILMAGTLMSIKAKMLLPRPETDEDELTEDDPRYELVRSLLEYKRYKETGQDFRTYEAKASREYYRGNFEPDEVTKPADGEALKDVTIIHLMAAIHDVMLRNTREEPMHHVQKPETSIEEQSSRILERLRKAGKISFTRLCEEATSKMMIVVTFLSVLEMIKEGQLELFITEQNHFEFYIDIPRVDSEQLLENV